MDTDTIKARIQAMPDAEIPRRSVENSSRFDSLGDERLCEHAVQEIKRLASENIIDPLGDRVYFAPGATETMRDYALHLAAGQDKPLSAIRAKRVLGIALAQDTVENPFAIIQQENGRKAYLSLYTDGKDFTNNIIVGVEEGQNGRVVTSMLTADKKNDKRAAVREFKKRISSSKEILYIWEGLSGHPRPSSEQ